MLILLIILLLVFGGGGGYYGHTRWGPGGGAGIGLGTILMILLIVYLLGGLRYVINDSGPNRTGSHRELGRIGIRYRLRAAVTAGEITRARGLQYTRCGARA